MSMEGKWDDKLRDKLKDYEILPPEGLWESLSDAFPDSTSNGGAEKSPLPYGVKRRNRWKRISIAAAILLLVCTGMISFFFTNKNLEMISDIPHIYYEQMNSVKDRESGDNAIPHDVPGGKKKGIARASLRESVPDMQMEPDRNIAAEDSVAESSDDEIPPYKEENKDINETSNDTLPRNSYLSERRPGGGSMIQNHATITTGKPKASGRLAFGLQSSYTGNNISDRALSPEFTGPEDPPSLPNPNEEESTEINHDLPVRIGMTVQYSFTDRLALETGLTYTYLSSRETIKRKSASTLTRYRLHYLGIPLSLKFRVASWGPMDVYLSAGGGLDKCVGGDIYRKVLNSSEAESRLPFADYPLQWSLRGAAGVQYRPFPLLGIYVEPGVVYYPPAHSKMPTLFEDRPVDFSLSVGVRFMLPR